MSSYSIFIGRFIKFLQVLSPPVRLFWMLDSLKPHGRKVPGIPKIAAEDTTLTVNNADGGKTTFPIVAGTEISLHVPGLHYNRMPSWCCVLGTDSDGVL